MALEDGAPRVAAPDLVRRLTPWERRLADRALHQRLGYAGLVDPEFPDDEHPASVAAWCVRTAATRAASRTALFFLGVFLTAAFVTNEVHRIPQPWARIIGIGSLALVALSGVVRVVRGTQVRRFLREHPDPAPRPSEPWIAPEPAGPIGPDQLAPVLLRRINRLEAAVVRSFFPGTGRISTGTPRWDGSPADRIILRRALRFDAWLFVLVLFGFCGSLLLDIALSGLFTLAGHGPENGISGVFVAGWVGALVWFARRRLQIRSWYRAGLGREAELARRIAALPRDPGLPVPAPPTPRKPASGRARILLAATTDVFLIGMAVYLVQGGLDARAESSPVPGGTTTTGTVVKVETFEGSRGGDTYRTRVRFTDESGRTWTIRGTQGEERARTGQPVQVSYDPDHPEDGHDITTNTSAWKWPFFTGLFPGVLALGSTIYLGVQIARGAVRWREEPDD